MKKNKDFFLELGCEEIPARFISSLSKSMQTSFEKCLVKNRISFVSLQVFSTYRRLAVFIQGISDIQEDTVDYIKGPPEKIVYDDQGGFSKASIGFAKKNNIELSNCSIKEINGKKHLCYENFLKGNATSKILPEIIPQIITSIPLNIAMRWSDKTYEFIRPVQWIVALLDAEVIKFKLFDVDSNNFSFGHRFLSEGKTSLGKKFVVNLKKSILDQYENHNVFLDCSKREALIKHQLINYDQHNLDNDLLKEVANLVEMPSLLKGNFDSKYLKLPDFVLIECMKKHQRYFPVYLNGKLQPSFLVVADNVTPENKATIVLGNQNVLIARLEDAMFFYQKDLSENLESFVSKLNGVVFQKNAGSMLDKQKRIYLILKFLKDKNWIVYEDSVLNRVATYSKFDLVSNMVLEFPSLQGKMGAIYLEAASEDKLISMAIKEQYLPAGQSTRMPTTHLGAVLGLADRFDTLIVSFKCGANPTGSQDPLGLRRAVIGICDLIFEIKVSLNIRDMVMFCLEVQDSNNDLVIKILDFFYLRIKTLFKEKNIDYDIVDAIKELIFTDLFESLKIANLLQRYKKLNFEKLKLISETAVRISRLAKHAKNNCVEQNLFEENIEKDLYEKCLKLQSVSALELDDFYSFSKEFTAYFEQILVMSENNQLKQNRLNFLKLSDDVFKKVANFENIAI